MRSVYLLRQWRDYWRCWALCTQPASRSASLAWLQTCCWKWPVRVLTIPATSLSSHFQIANFWYAFACISFCTLAEKSGVFFKKLLFLFIAFFLLLLFLPHARSLSLTVFHVCVLCNLQDYTIDSNWRLRSTVLTPMFMETQVTQAAGTQQADSAEMQPASMKGQIRATQASLEFSQTQAPGAGAFLYSFIHL